MILSIRTRLRQWSSKLRQVLLFFNLISTFTFSKLLLKRKSNFFITDWHRKLFTWLRNWMKRFFINDVIFSLSKLLCNVFKLDSQFFCHNLTWHSTWLILETWKMWEFYKWCHRFPNFNDNECWISVSPILSSMTSFVNQPQSKSFLKLSNIH